MMVPQFLQGKKVLIRRIALENVRSFLDRAELRLDGPISIVIGPNGGGKTNLLDTVVMMLRRHLFASMYAVHAPTPEHQNRYEFRHNDALNNMVLEKYTGHASKQQIVEVEVEITQKDLDGMRTMQADASRLQELANKKYVNINFQNTQNWNLGEIKLGERLIYKLVDGTLSHNGKNNSTAFLQYLQAFEMDGRLREEYGLSPLSTPLIYLPVNRAASGFQSSVQLSGYNEFEAKRHSDAASSRSGTQIVNLAVGRLAQKYRLLLEADKGVAAKEFKEDPNLVQLTSFLGQLGYEWSLETINALTNQYDIRLKKQGSSFLVGAASSGERELLTYLFAIFALNVRDALIIVDEPELHLHPKWQQILLTLFVQLSRSTGNQFLIATHSPTFVSPDSIQYVSRVYSREQKSQIVRLDTTALPESKHLLNIVNSQNNERLFFADRVALVEGLSDRIFFEALLGRFKSETSATATNSILEIISVGGKGLFKAYARLLNACHIEFSIISDLDYVEQVGSQKVRELFKTDTREIKVDVVDNIKSLDGDALVRTIDYALASGNWDNARDVWEYVKSRRRQLKENLSEEETTILRDFLAEKREERVFILSRGALEAYLPNGYKSKDLEKLIQLLAESDFWHQLPQDTHEELGLISKALLQE